MDKVRAWLRPALSMFRLAGIGAGGLAVVFGLIADISGGSTFWSLTPDDWLRVGLVLIALFGAATLFRHEYLMHEFGQMWGNEHARKLLQDGIPPYRGFFFQHLRDGNYAIANRFWLAGFVNITDSRGKSDIHLACEKGHSAIADGIIRLGGDPKRPDSEGLTPLMLAAIEGHKKVAETLLQHDCAMNAKSADHGVSALFIAAAHGRLSVVGTLQEEGAEIDAFDHNNMTPLMAAIAQRKWDVANFLLGVGADATRKDGSGATMLDHASVVNAPKDLIGKLKAAGAKASTPKLKSTGRGFSRTGHVRVQWEHERE